MTYGIFVLHWKSETWLYTTYFTTSLIVQFASEWIGGNKNIPLLERYRKGIPSVLISSFGLSLLLKTNEPVVAMMAATVSILSKYILRINGKHIFNPSALGIVAAVLFTGKAWISPGQWGSDAILVFAVLSLGFIVTTKVQKIDVSLAFLGSFGGLLFIRQIIYLGWPMDHFIQSVSTGSLLLFAFFMITDPKTTPNHPAARVLWSIAIGCVAFYLATFRFINGAPVYVLVAAQPLIPLLDKLFKAKSFEWTPSTKMTIQEERFLQTIYSKSVM